MVGGRQESALPPPNGFLLPQSRPERIAFALGLAVIVAFAVALIPAYTHYRSSSSPSDSSGNFGTSVPNEKTVYRPKPAKTKPAAPVVQPQQTRVKTSTGTQAHAHAKTKPKPAAPAPASRQAKVALSATRGDCWVEARKASATGKVIYVGTLTKGKSVTLNGSHLWIRFGAPQNIDVVINGKPATIPGGSQNYVVTPKGVKATA